MSDQSSPIILIGPMGSGKSTVGQHIAQHLNASYADTDALFVERHGVISTYFSTHGEPAFRDAEQHIIAEAMQAPQLGVISLGGGAVLRSANREIIRDRGYVIFLDVSEDQALERLGDASARPVLAGDPARNWSRIRADRLDLFRITAHNVIDTTGLDVDDVATKIIDGHQQFLSRKTITPMSENTTTDSTDQPTVIPVSGGGEHEVTGGYDVVIGRGLLSKLPAILGPHPYRVAIILPRALRATGDVVKSALDDAGYDAILVEIPDSEEGKHIEVASFCWQVLGQSDFTRSDAVVSVGGGAVSDLAGFVAATWLRGVRVVHMPTTLLGMVDAAVGGKTGINTAEGKNLVGSFHPPAGVLADLDTLLTLPKNEIISGLAEVVKCGFISDERILELIEENESQVTNPHSPVLRELIERAIQVKADVVTKDFKESNERHMLNYGHTLGHAIELAERYQYRHGAAVAVGMVFAAELARSVGRLDDATVERHKTILEGIGLPTSYHGDRWATLLDGIRRDKKNRGEQLRFILLEAQGSPIIYDVPDESLLFAAYQEIAD